MNDVECSNSAAPGSWALRPYWIVRVGHTSRIENTRSRFSQRHLTPIYVSEDPQTHNGDPLQLPMRSSTPSCG